MRAFNTIAVTQDGFVATIEISRPPHNFFDIEMINDIADACGILDEDASCRAIVLAAKGTAFCAGAKLGGDNDVGDLLVQKNQAGNTQSLYHQAVRLFRTKKPIVGAIHGAAVGGGLGFFIGPSLTGYLSARFSMRAPIYLAALMSATSILCTATLLRGLGG